MRIRAWMVFTVPPLWRKRPIGLSTLLTIICWTASMETRGQRSDAYHKLREAIVSGQYHPNERLVEASIAQRMGAGRTAVRAALVRLDQEGLVEIEPNRGARVRLISDREALEIEEVRAALEGMLARRAAARVTAEDLSALRQVITEMRERVEAGDSIGYSELNATFHQRIWTAADHPTASHLLGSLKSKGSGFSTRPLSDLGAPSGLCASTRRYSARSKLTMRTPPRRRCASTWPRSSTRCGGPSTASTVQPAGSPVSPSFPPSRPAWPVGKAPSARAPRRRASPRSRSPLPTAHRARALCLPPCPAASKSCAHPRQQPPASASRC